MKERLQQPILKKTPDLVPVLKADEIHQKVVSLARRISADYQHEHLLLLGVLKGAFVFLSDLARQLTIPVEIDFIQLSSYGCSDSSGGEIAFRSDISVDVANKHILVVEDIIDTGLTITRLIEYLQQLGARSVKVCALIDKYERREIAFHADYICHTVKSGFLVGYGLDYAEQYRNLPAIYDLKF
ncbi:MAG: hypoxanthine phosphoribosyltransferase [Desulfobacterales bacterium]|nr:hypoxanthine phosphoribosyltransferase [Desulfobacterales bacterium]